MKLLRTLPLFASITGLAMAQAPLFDIPGQANQQLGHGMSPIADMDGDGRPDLVVGAIKANGLQPGSGIVRVVSSKTGGTLLTLLGEKTGDDFGWSVLGIPDQNGDGKPEIVVGAPLWDGTSTTSNGKLYVFSGANGSLMLSLSGNAAGDRFGWRVCSAGDVNGDGKLDFATGAPGHSPGANPKGGGVFVYSGATLGLIRSYGGLGTSEELGTSVDALGDVNGDGFPDLIAGAPELDTGAGVNAGAVRILSGAASNAFLFQMLGTSANQKLGSVVCGVPDVNLDGKPEYAIGEPDFTNAFTFAGRTRVFSGASNALIRTFTGTGQQDFLGNSIAGVKDFDLDGRGDIVVGSFGYDNGPAAFAGRVDVFSVQTGASLASWTGNATFEGMGTRVASAGDLNGDGATDVMGSSPTGSTYASAGGYVSMFLGNAPAPTAYCTPKVNSQGCTPYILTTGTLTMSLGVGMGVTAANVIPGQNGMMIWSLTSASTPFFGGTLCLGGAINRTAVQSAVNIGGTNPCQGAYQFLVDQPFMTSEGLSAGMNFFLQFWSRDNGFSAPNNVGLTGGIRAKIVP